MDHESAFSARHSRMFLAGIHVTLDWMPDTSIPVNPVELGESRLRGTDGGLDERSGMAD